MSSAEYYILCLIALADIAVSAAIPWIMALAVAAASACAALLVRRIVCRLNIM